MRAAASWEHAMGVAIRRYRAMGLSPVEAVARARLEHPRIVVVDAAENAEGCMLVLCEQGDILGH